MMFADKLLQAVNLFPTGITMPTGTFSTQVIKDISYTATSFQGVLTETGWYRVKIGAADGAGANTSYGYGGKIMHTFFAYSGTKYLLWGCDGPSTGYPVPSGNGGYYYNPTTQNLDGEDGILGGGGGSGSDKTTQGLISHGGPGGGSATGNGATNTGASGNVSGAGCGFICGLDEIGTTLTTQTESFVDPNYAGFSVDSVIAMVLAGGGGSYGVGGGGGGGAYGNGGHGVKWNSVGLVITELTNGGTGPGGTTFGVGADGTYASSGNAGEGGNGAWCVRDYSTSTFTSGTGQQSPISAGTCRLEKLIY